MNQDIAREVMAILATTERKVTTGWKWRKGVVLFPESRCPFCKLVIKSKAIWVVRDNYLIGQAVPVAGRTLVLDSPQHPHATPSAICMGDASDPLQALFNGLNPDSAYISPIPWLRGKYWEHSCDEMAQAEDDPEWSCESCGDGLGEDDTYNFDDCIYCNDCFYDRAFYCYNCGDTYPQDERRSGANDRDYCSECFNEKFFECSACDEVLELDQLMRDGECVGCYEYPNTCAREECGDGFDLDESGTTCTVCSKDYCSIYCRSNHECVEVTE